jgi:thiol:disulfide interchange protein
MKIFGMWLLFVFSGISQTWAAGTSVYPFGQGRVELVASGLSSLGLHFKLDPGWHIYWKNSGDSGAPPKWTWQVEGAKIKTEHWPVPARLPIATLINLGYEKEALFKFDLSPAAEAGSIAAHVKLEFLVCKEECIPYFAELSKSFTKDAAAPGPKKNPFDRAWYPESAPAGLTWKIRERGNEQLVTELRLPADLQETIKNLEIFPEDGESFKATAPEVQKQGDHFALSLALQDTSKTDFDGARFLLVTENLQGQKKAYEVVLKDAPKTGFGMILLFALLGGLILNFMPCVFPVLSIKVLSFLGPDKNYRQLRHSGWFYTLGVLVSFLALGGLLLLLRSGGEQIGWGFQLQSPVMASGIAILFFWLGLNFLGSFEIGQSLTYIGATKTSNDHWGSFLTGVLATVIATPCTAPFMGAALGASLTLAPLLMLLVFASLGLGMALPFLVLAYFPQALRLLPKPGRWMQTLKEFLAFPLFATVLWLLWVLAQQTQTASLLFVLAVFLLASLVVWISHQIDNERWKQGFLVLGFVASFGMLKLLPTEKASSVAAAPASSEWGVFQEAKVAADVKAGQAVFIDFTAAWCISCQVNKKLVLHTEEIQKAFADHRVKLYRGDWTDKDPLITKALAGYGRNSLPLYVYYAPGSATPQLLPEVLTQGMILDLLNKEKNP